MNRDNLIGDEVIFKGGELIHQIAFHEAGHAAAIYLRNRLLNLPPVYFHISLVGFNKQKSVSTKRSAKEQWSFQPLLKGGFLHTEHLSMLDNRTCSSVDCDSCRSAYEADAINLLAGPLAEARYVAIRDGEAINRYLINPAALKNYGGSSDVEMVENYLNAYSEYPNKREEKLEHLFSASFDFVSRPENWQAISRLARYLVQSEEETIAYEDAIQVLEESN